MSGNGRLATRTLLALPLATGVLLAIGCGLKPGGGGGIAPSKEPTGAVPSGGEGTGVTTKAPTGPEEKPTTTTPRKTLPRAPSAMEIIGAMTSAEIDDLTKAIDRQIESEKKRHHKRLEPLFDVLKRVCLREPDYRAVSQANTLEQMVHSGATAESIRRYAGMFLRETTKERVEAIAKEIETHYETVESLKAKKPGQIVRARWNEIVGELNERFGHANSLLRGGTEGLGGKATRQALLNAIAELEQADGERDEKTDSLKAVLHDSRQKLDALVRHVRHFGKYADEGKDAISMIDEKVAELDALKAADRAAIFEYHKRFVSALLEKPGIDSLNLIARAVKGAKAEAADMWKLPMFERLYAEWQANGYEAILRAGLRDRLHRAMSKLHVFRHRLRGREVEAAAGLVTDDEVSALRTFLDTGVLSVKLYGSRAPGDVRQRARRSTRIIGVTLERDREALATFAGKRQEVLGTQATRRAADEQAGRVSEYHAALKRTVTEAADLAALAAVKTTIEAERKANPDYWRDTKVLREYANTQARRFHAIFEDRFGKRPLAAVRKRLRKSAYPEPWKEACRAFTQAEVEAVLGFLQSGVIDQRAFDGRLQHLTGFNQDKLRAVSLKFWQEVGKVVGAGVGD